MREPKEVILDLQRVYFTDFCNQQALAILATYREEIEAPLRAEIERLREAASEMAEVVALLPAENGQILGLLPILCRLRAALAPSAPEEPEA